MTILRSNFALALAAAFVGLLVVAPVASAQSAEILIQQGIDLRRQQRDAEALQHFQDAYGLSQSAEALAQIALAEQALGNYVEAEVHLQQALATQDAWINMRRPQLQEALGQISAQLGTIEIAGGVAGAQVFVNGVERGTFPQAARIRARAGSAVIEVRAQGYLSVQRTVMVM
ncbi:MAG: tetratricopeptide repeat protein, partial [Sandaracinaceae bacterium]